MRGRGPEAGSWEPGPATARVAAYVVQARLNRRLTSFMSCREPLASFPTVGIFSCA